MAVLFLVCFTTSNPPICLGLSFWIHAIGLCSSNTDAKTDKNSRSLRSSEEAQSTFPNKSLPDFQTQSLSKQLLHHRQANPFKPLAGNTYTFMKPFKEMQH